MKSMYLGMDPLPEEKITPTVGLNRTLCILLTPCPLTSLSTHSRFGTVARIPIGRRVLVTWDVGGQRSLIGMWDRYFNEAHAVVFVIDSSDTVRMDEARSTFHTVVADPRLAGAPVLLLCNKMDKDDAIDPDVVADAFGVTDVPDHNMHVAPICAKDGTGVTEAFDWLLAALQTSPRQIIR